MELLPSIRNTMLFLSMPIFQAASTVLSMSFLQVEMLFPHMLTPQVLAIPLQVMPFPPAKSIIQVASIYPQRSATLIALFLMSEMPQPNELTH